MRRVVSRFLQVCVIAGLLAHAGATASFAPSPLRYGVSDDYGKFHGCASAFWPALRDIGYTVNRMTVEWDESKPATIVDKAFLDEAVRCAQSRRIRVLLAVLPKHPGAIGTSAAARSAFARYAALVAATYRTVDDFVIGNEPNQPRFWQPQFSGREAVAGRDYEATLARTYDAIKAVRPDANVIGFAVSSRGGDDPSASSNVSRSPVWFIHDAAAAYRTSGRTKPIMDAFAFHPYPNANTNSFTRRFQWPKAGAADLGRIKQALWDGFHATAQPVPAELPIVLSEAGTQTGVAGHEAAYTGTENVPVVGQATQSRYHEALMEIAACDPGVTAVLFFLLVDQPELENFQSGNLFADLAHKGSYDAVKSTIAAAHGLCRTTPAAWVHTEVVVAAGADFSEAANRNGDWKVWHFLVRAREAATFRAGIFPAALGRRKALGALASGSGTRSVRWAVGRIAPYIGRQVGFTVEPLPRGRYFYAIRLRAIVNPARSSSFTSRTFSVGGG